MADLKRVATHVARTQGAKIRELQAKIERLEGALRRTSVILGLPAERREGGRCGWCERVRCKPDCLSELIRATLEPPHLTP